MHSVSSHDPLSLGVATPERVSLDLPVAGIGSRVGAYLLDAAFLFLFWLVVYFVFSFAMDVVDVVQRLSGLMQVLVTIGVFATQWIYWTASEVLWNGQTLGKRLAGIRVVREDGSPVGFFESAVRNLLRAIDFLPMLYATGVLTMLVNARNRRLGDIAAGTLLIRQERINLDRYTAPAAHASASVSGASTPPSGAPALSAHETELILSFLERAAALAPDARARLASGLIEKFGASLASEDRARLRESWPDAERFLRSLVHR